MTGMLAALIGLGVILATWTLVWVLSVKLQNVGIADVCWGAGFVVLAWVFVIFRWAQAGVHVTSNDVRFRGATYFVGAIVLVVMWVIFIVRILLGLP